MTRDAQMEMAAYEMAALWNASAAALNFAARLILSIVMVTLLTLTGWLEWLHKGLEPKGRDDARASDTVAVHGRCSR